MTTRPLARLVAVAAVALLPFAAAACSASDQDSSSADAPAEAPGESKGLADSAGGESGDSGGTATTAPDVTPPDDDRSLIIVNDQLFIRTDIVTERRLSAVVQGFVGIFLHVRF